MCALRIFEKKIVLCKKGDEITGLDGTGPPGYIGWRNSFLGIDSWAL
jgi:hypothetical protein